MARMSDKAPRCARPRGAGQRLDRVAVDDLEGQRELAVRPAQVLRQFLQQARVPAAPRKAAKRFGCRLAPSSRSSRSTRSGVSKARVMRSMSITGSAKPAVHQHVAPVVHVGEFVAGAGQPSAA
jgi:hypothetical protein